MDMRLDETGDAELSRRVDNHGATRITTFRRQDKTTIRNVKIAHPSITPGIGVFDNDIYGRVFRSHG